MADKDEQLDTTDQHRTPPDVQMRGMGPISMF